MRYVPGVKMSGCISWIYGWMVMIINAERSRGYSLYTLNEKLAQLADWIQAGEAPVSNGLPGATVVSQTGYGDGGHAAGEPGQKCD